MGGAGSVAVIPHRKNTFGLHTDKISHKIPEGQVLEFASVTAICGDGGVPNSDIRQIEPQTVSIHCRHAQVKTGADRVKSELHGYDWNFWPSPCRLRMINVLRIT